MKIQNLSVKGFRSLWDETVNRIGQVNIFYGENNTGKSNILGALEILFKVERVEELGSPVAGFLRGELTNFADNFTVKPNGEKSSIIELNARILMNDKDLEKLPDFSDFIRSQGIYESGHSQRIQLEVEIHRSGYDTAIRMVKKVSINNKVIYNPMKSDIERFFPGYTKKVSKISDRQRPAEELFLYLINSFELIKAERFLQTESVAENHIYKLSPQQFKNWILGMSQGREEVFETFQSIAHWFNEKPFEFGTIRPTIYERQVDIVVSDNLGREFLIDRLGTGVQQILMLLSQIACSNAKVIGIEEIELNLSPRLQNKTLNMLKEIVRNPESGSLDQLMLTSHSMHLSNREDVILYAIELSGEGETKVKKGTEAVRKIREQFDLGLFRITKKGIRRV